MWSNKKKNATFPPATFGNYLIKEVLPQEWPLVRTFYLRALKTHPSCSSYSYEEKKQETPETWQETITQSWQDPNKLFCVAADKSTGNIAAFVQIVPHAESKLSHQAQVVAFYADPARGNADLLRFLWRCIITYYAKATGIKKLKVAVLTKDGQTVTLFHDLGFMRYGFDETYYRIGRSYAPALLMQKML